MIKKITLYSLIGFLLLSLAVWYNYQNAQKAIREQKPSVLTSDLVSYPEKIMQNGKGTFFWHVDTPNDLIATKTTLYWSYESTPSALTAQDSPEAVGYPNYTNDYLVGEFKLPDTFDSEVQFSKAGRVYFRSYAKVRDQHLWSEEYSLTVLPSGYVE